RHRYISLVVDVLIGQRDEVPGTNPGIGRDEETTRCGLKNRDAHHVANAKFDLLWGTLVGERTGDPGRPGRQYVDDPGSHLDQSVGKAFRIPWIATAVDFSDVRPRGWHNGASAAQQG